MTHLYNLIDVDSLFLDTYELLVPTAESNTGLSAQKSDEL